MLMIILIVPTFPWILWNYHFAKHSSQLLEPIAENERKS